MPKDVNIYLAFEIIGCQSGSVLVQEVIIYLNRIQDRVGLEESAVVGHDLSFFICAFSPCIQEAKVKFKPVV